jgi:hypothetical protein
MMPAQELMWSASGSAVMSLPISAVSFSIVRRFFGWSQFADLHFGQPWLG